MSDLEIRIEKSSEVLALYSISSDNIKKVLLALGIDDSEIGLQILNSDSVSFNDFDTQFAILNPSIAHNIPKPRLTFAWNCLKKKDESSSNPQQDLSALTKAIRPIAQWGDLELLEQYGKDCPQAIEEELSKRAKNRYCIVFNDDSSVDVENSLYMLRKARHQDMPATFIIREKMTQLYRIGEFPLDIFYECPIHSNVLLIDGYCDECGKKWDTHEHDRNTFLRLIVKNESVDMRLYRNKTMEDLVQDFPKVYLIYKDLKEEGKLPSLKRKLSKTKSGDPFRVVSSHHAY